jgi:hypothetical protein
MLTEMKERGERAKAGDNQYGGSSGAKLPLSDLGISKTESSRWQKTAISTLALAHICQSRRDHIALRCS